MQFNKELPAGANNRDSAGQGELSASGCFSRIGAIGELCSRNRSGVNQPFYQFVRRRVSLDKIDAVRCDATIGVVFLAYISLSLEVPQSEVQVLSWERHALFQIQHGKPRMIFVGAAPIVEKR